MKTFLIPTGDDPERDSSAQERKAEAKPDRDTKKARPKLPAGCPAVYVEKVTPKKKGNVEWSEVTFSSGESFPVQAYNFQLITLCMELAQSTDAVIIETKANAKGNQELEMVRRWKAGDPLPQVPEPKPNGQAPELITADDIHF